MNKNVRLKCLVLSCIVLEHTTVKVCKRYLKIQAHNSRNIKHKWFIVLEV